MFVRLNEKTARRLRAQFAGMGFCDEGVGDAIDALLIDGGGDLSAVVDAICLGEGFQHPDLVDRKIWRSIRDLVEDASRKSVD